jgi:hypothetical protein|tara:strand:+ start:131 stop:370 length:240 start_codon:yes stop_codon:yes gene_type:complete
MFVVPKRTPCIVVDLFLKRIERRGLHLLACLFDPEALLQLEGGLPLQIVGVHPLHRSIRCVLSLYREPANIYNGEYKSK